MFNLKSDVMFKAFFTRKGNEKFLIDFLESILDVKIKKIEIQQEVNLGKLFKEEKTGSLDVQDFMHQKNIQAHYQKEMTICNTKM